MTFSLYGKAMVDSERLLFSAFHTHSAGTSLGVLVLRTCCCISLSQLILFKLLAETYAIYFTLCVCTVYYSIIVYVIVLSFAAVVTVILYLTFYCS